MFSKGTIMCYMCLALSYSFALAQKATKLKLKREFALVVFVVVEFNWWPALLVALVYFTLLR